MNNLPYELIIYIGIYLSNNDLSSFIINKELYNILYNDLLDRKKKNRLAYFYYVWKIIKRNKIKRFYEFSMINYYDKVIIQFLVGVVESEDGYYRELLHYTKKNEETIGNYHNIGILKWKEKSFNGLIGRAFNLVKSGYHFDNNSVLSKIPNFNGKYIL
jgi:hypothetical protein